MEIIAILAMDLNNGIGINNKLPWNIKEEMELFKNKTINNIVIMGKNTFLSLKKPLRNRINIVISNDNNFIKEMEQKKKEDKNYQHVMIKNDLNFLKELKETKKDTKVFIIGGKTLYEKTFNYCDKIYLSLINKEYECDTFIEYDFEEKFIVENIQLYDDFAFYQLNKKS